MIALRQTGTGNSSLRRVLCTKQLTPPVPPTTKSKASTICRESSSLSKSERWAAAGALDCVNEETVKLWCCSGM